MRPLSCSEVLEQIELYAAGECDEAERSAMRQHLAHCPTCSKAERESRQLLGLLELRLRESEGLRRLQLRLPSEERRPKSIRLLPFARRAAAMAAMLLLAVGLSMWFRAQEPFGNQNPLVVAWGPSESVRAVPMQFEEKPAVAAFKADDSRVYDLDLGGKTAKQFRQEITNARDRSPEPPLVNLGLLLRNSTEEELAIHVGGKGSELKIDLTGPGVVVTAAAADVAAVFLVPKSITLQPGQSYRLPISRLVYGTRGKVQSAYWTEPGEYTLTLRYKVAVSDALRQDSRFVTLRSPPMPIQVRLKNAPGK